MGRLNTGGIWDIPSRAVQKLFFIFFLNTGHSLFLLISRSHDVSLGAPYSSARTEIKESQRATAPLAAGTDDPMAESCEDAAVF